MPFDMNCPQCAKAFRVPDDGDGKRGQCPWCKATVQLQRSAAIAAARPSPASAQVLPCPKCSQSFGIPPEAAGQRVACPFCRSEVSVETGPGGLTLVPGGGESPGGLDPGDKFLAMLTRPPAAPTRKADKQAEGSGSRYGSRLTTESKVVGDCVVRGFFCEENAAVASALTERLKNLLEKEECFQSVVVQDDPSAWGEKVTVDAGLASIDEVGGGFLEKAGCSIMASTSVFIGTDQEETVSANAKLQGGRPNSMRTKLTKLVAQKLGTQIVKACAPYKHTYKEISDLATATCVLGCLGAIPGFGFICFPISLITAIVAWVYNRGREEKVGAARMLTGLIVGFLFCVIWIIVFATSS